MPVAWPDDVDEVIHGDLTAGVAWTTPAGGCVITAVAPCGLRDREAGTVTFTTSLGFGKKLNRIRKDPRVALSYHARDHGHASGDQLVLVQGTARIVEQPDRDWLENVLTPAATRHLGAPRRGFFWDRWLQEYYADRVPVHVDVERIVVWPDLAGAGEPAVYGAPLPAGDPAPQDAPAKGTGPRVDARQGRREAALPPPSAARVPRRGRLPVRRPVRGRRGLRARHRDPGPRTPAGRAPRRRARPTTTGRS